MWDEIKKSINSTLYERITSPFYGTLIISWAIWNWKIIYLTIFVSENKIPVDKVSYILANYSNIWCLVGFPLLSTIILLTGMQYVSNWAYYLSLYFLKLKKDKKRKYENKEMLTVEQSIELRTSLHDFQIKYEKMLETKEADIKNLNSSIENILNDKKNELLKKDEEIRKFKDEKEVILNQITQLQEKADSFTVMINELQSKNENNNIIKRNFKLHVDDVRRILEYSNLKFTDNENIALIDIFDRYRFDVNLNILFNTLKNIINKDFTNINTSEINLASKEKLIFSKNNSYELTKLGQGFLSVYALSN